MLFCKHTHWCHINSGTSSKITAVAEEPPAASLTLAQLAVRTYVPLLPSCGQIGNRRASLALSIAVSGPTQAMMPWPLLPAFCICTSHNQAWFYTQAHFGPWFMTFHEAFIMEFENALLSVVPGLKALPYWEMYEDFQGMRSSWLREPPGTLS